MVDKSLPAIPSFAAAELSSNGHMVANDDGKPTTPMKELDFLLQTNAKLPESSPEQNLHKEYNTLFSDNNVDALFEDEALIMILEQHTDMDNYAQTVQQQRRKVQQDLETDYASQVQSFVQLHNTIESCDSVLGRMEELLNDLQSDLGNISNEIQTLQEQSSHMSLRLRNRKLVESKLGRALQGMVIPPDVIKKLTDGDIDELWQRYLNNVNKQMRFVKANHNKPVKAFKDVGPELEKLRLLAAASIRDFFVSRIQSICVPNANIQIMQQSTFLKHKDLYMFVLERYHDAAEEIKQTYINSLRWYFQNHFERYSRGLAKLQTASTDKTDLIGADEHSRTGGMFKGASLGSKGNVFALGDRMETLKSQDAGVILVHVAEHKSEQYQFEQLFRSFNLTLIDNASSEYLFILDFFSPDAPTAADTAKPIFQQIFEPTIKIGSAFTKSLVEYSFDAVGILLCIRINTQLALELQRRRVPTLEGYTNSTNMQFWPRFQQIMTMHTESLKKLANSKSAMSAIKDVHPHYITRRYAEFVVSLLTLNEGYNDAILTNSIQKLRNEFEALLNRMAREFSEHIRQVAFLINNYDLVVGILQEAHNQAVASELDHVTGLLKLHIQAFIDEQLRASFGSLLHSVQTKTTDKGDLERVAIEFARTWRSSITAVNARVVQSFSNFKNGTNILHGALQQLIELYTTFYDQAQAQEVQTPNMVDARTVMEEVKKFRHAF